jgi:hypothetical protein
VDLSQRTSGWTGSSHFSSLVFPLEFQQFLDDFVGVHFQIIEEVLLDLSLQLAL